MLTFDPAGAAKEEATAWDESAKASAGLTSDEVHRKGSLAVQQMLRWLEVSRLTRMQAVGEGEQAKSE